MQKDRNSSAPNGGGLERIDFSKIRTALPIPNLIEVQKRSYDRFLQMDRLPSEREDFGLQLGVQVRQPERTASPARHLPELRRYGHHQPLRHRSGRPLHEVRDIQQECRYFLQ